MLELLGRMDMIVAAGGGERDEAVDAAILTNRRKAANPDAFLNERLMNDLRPTLFLAQLSNLLAGNISIVHHVTGSSRTFMGEEAAGVDAVRIALARINAGQSELALVGGSHNGERHDLLLLYDAGGHMLRGPYRPVWERTGAAGMVLGSLGAFLVLESRSHAEARNAKPLARLATVMSERSSRPAGAHHGRARADVAEPRAATRIRAPRRDLGGDRRGTRDRRGARLARDLARRAGARHRQRARPRLRAAIRHEHCACGARARSPKVVPARRIPPGSNRRMKVRSTRSPSPRSGTGAARAWRWSRR